jgi:Fe-S-cluster-containing dehydrogenase component
MDDRSPTLKPAADMPWRGLDELDRAAHAHDGISHVALTPPGAARRDFLRLMAASLALATGGCARAPLEKIVPYRDGPAQDGYGKPVFYASALERDGYGVGVLVETNMGRPTKIEGNPSHPASLGATDIFAQAAVLELWDPDRSTAHARNGQIDTWPRFIAELGERLRAQPDGAGLAMLTETVTSPTLADQLRAIAERHPRARVHQYQPVNRDAVYDGARLAFGEAVEPVHHFGEAAIIVALDADIVGSMPGALRHARDIAAARRGARRPRIYAAEGSPSLTGALADRRLVMRTGDIAALVDALAAHVLGEVGAGDAALGADATAWLDALVADLASERSRAIVVAGDRQPARVHARVHAINHALGNGALVTLREPVAASTGNQVESLRALVSAMRDGQVTTLVMLGGNPAYAAPRDLDFAGALQRVPWSAHLALYPDETSALSTWHVAAAHPLESWGDMRAYDGTPSLRQPAIAPLYDGRSAHEVLSIAQDGNPRSGHAIVRDYWQRRHPQDFEAFWQAALRDGTIAEPVVASPPRALRAIPPAGAATAGARTVELVLASDPTLGDGRHANNAWLQELPKPLTTLTWGNAAQVSPGFARDHALANEDMVEVRTGARRVRVPVWIVPGHADAAVTLHLGHGRLRAGGVGNRVGVDVYPLLDSTGGAIVAGVEVIKVAGRWPLAAAQTHHRMEGRDLVRSVTREEAQRCAAAGCTPLHARDPHDSLYPSFPYDGYRWGMSIDLDACIGCGACTIACQAENNIPVVGRDEVLRGREMHWIRVDRYYAGPAEAPRTLFQPVPCMQCEHAPCEEVCPVEASVHDTEGLNVQVYNRCVGTRFCSNNCPYKVRRFNWHAYVQDMPSLDAQRNPEVTVRMRGVMEKCSYCIQRIEVARIDADRGERRIADGEVVTACQAVCPTRAIVFGDLNDAASAVNARKASPLDYALLAELNTRPRTTYLPRIVDDETPTPSAPSATTGRTT